MIWFGHTYHLLLTLHRPTIQHTPYELPTFWASLQYHKCLPHWYNHRGDHIDQYLWVPVYLYSFCSSLTCGTTYKPHRWNIYLWNRFIYIHPFTNDDFDAKDTYVDAFSISFSLHSFVDLLYRDIISQYHNILTNQFHISNWYRNNSS